MPEINQITDLNGTTYDIRDTSKVNSNQGAANAGKALGIDNTGAVVPVPFSGEDFTGATSSTDGTHGYVPAPEAGDDEKVLMGDGAWHTLSPSASSDIITVTGTVTNVSGAYSGTISNANVTEDMMPVRVVVGNRAAFLDEDLQVTCNNGSVSLACSSVSGTSTITVYVFGSQDTSLMQAWSGGDY